MSGKITSLSSICVTLCAAFILYVIVGGIVNDRKLPQFKGPPLAGFTRLWIFIQALKRRLPEAEMEALQKYGSPCRFGPNLLLTDDPELLRHMSAPRSRWTRSVYYEAMRFDPRCDTVFSTRDEKHHSYLRTQMIGAYSGKEIDNLESDIDACILELQTLIKREYSGRPMDMAQISQYFTLDVLSTIAFGEPFGYMAANKDLWDYNKISAEFMLFVELASNHNFIRSIISSRPFQWLAAPKGTDKVGLGRIVGIAQKAVAERYQPNSKAKRDMLGHFVSKGLSQVQAEVESNVQILAGSDSTATVLRVTLMHLIASPDAYARLRTEIDDAVATGNISSPVATYEEAMKLPYLDAVIWEGIRLWPPLLGFLTKLAPTGGDTVNGIFYPEGTEVCVCPMGVGRRKDIFGEDADIFRPGRWTEANAETRRKYERATEVVFGSGRFACLGKNIAMIELHKVFVELLKNFHWAIADPLRGIDSVGQGVYIQSNMNLLAWPRQR